MGRRDRGPRRGGLIGMGVRGLSSGIGLMSESIKANKESKATEREEQEYGSSSRRYSEGDRPTPDIDAILDAPPSYSQASGSKSDRDQYPQDKQTSYLEAPNEGEVVEREDNLEEEWELDEAQDQIIDESPDNEPIKDSEKLVDTFTRNHPPPKYSQQGNLALPVVIPQRRPKDRSRGFVRAYAPILENCGIDQATWLEFLDTFQKSSVANPWLNAINMAQFATLAIPGFGIGLAVGYAISKITDITIEMESRRKTNNFLQKINAEFFQPRGLYCLVMTWNPESNQRLEYVNITDTIASRSNQSTGPLGITSKYRSSDGKTAEWEFPEVAPLVFPALDHLAAQTGTGGVQKKNKIASSMAFVANYWDKRATANYAKENPDSVLAQVPQPKFRSRYADPNNPAASGSLIAFVSGGHLVPEPHSRGLIGGVASVIGQAVRGEKQGQAWENIQTQTTLQQNRYGREYRGRGRRNRRARSSSDVKLGIISTPIGLYRKVLNKNVLYMMVVNMPTEEEMAEARALMLR